MSSLLELISALKAIESLNLLEPWVFINANNKLAVRYKNGDNSYGVWVIDIDDHAHLSNIE